MMELKESEFREKSDEEPNELADNKEKMEPVKAFTSDFQIDTDLEIMFPDEYVSNIAERIRLYKELNEIDSEEKLEEFEKKLTDRFGILPPPATALLDIVRIKRIAVQIGIEKILLKNDLLIAYFISDHNSLFYSSPLFVSIMNYVNKHRRNMTMKQKTTKLSLTISSVKSVKEAIKVLNEILEDYNKSA
jgi:transcription-repair coupling factor (superfamily II helicase)